ncbi:hypothetical protein [Pseudomonas sp. TWI929]|uniref:hypothetical protein n=1 Tax=Pseudomonas sp. TWI929 TaxID=3136795 RepID=UPI00320AF965
MTVWLTAMGQRPHPNVSVCTKSAPSLGADFAYNYMFFNDFYVSSQAPPALLQIQEEAHHRVGRHIRDTWQA